MGERVRNTNPQTFCRHSVPSQTADMAWKSFAPSQERTQRGRDWAQAPPSIAAKGAFLWKPDAVGLAVNDVKAARRNLAA